MASPHMLLLKRAFSLSTRALLQQEQVIRPPVQVTGVEGKYAAALYSSGVKQNNLDKLEKDLNQVKAIYDTNKDFKV
jgi:F-type H+-transporting ATPase subunit O